MLEAEFQRMGAREQVKMASWIKPKGEHRKFTSKLLQVRAHLLLCFRAEEKIEMVKNSEGKMEVRKKVTSTGLDGWVPICEKNLPYELTASFLLMASRPGVPLPIKLQQQHKVFFPLDQPITEESGKLLAAWASGTTPKAAPAQAPAGATSASPSESLRPALDAAPISAEQVRQILSECEQRGINVARLLVSAKVQKVEDIMTTRFEKVMEWIRSRK
jgi:hypothetical protein